IEVFELVDRRLAGYATRGQPGGDVVAHEARRHITQKEVAVKLVAAIFGDEVRVDTTTTDFGGDAVCLVGRLGDHFVIHGDLDHPIGLSGVDAHAVKQINVAPGRITVRLHVSLLGLLRAGDVGKVEVDTWCVRAHRLRIARTGQRIHVIAGEDGRVRDVFD